MPRSISAISTLSVALVASLVACNSDKDRSIGQTSFESAPPNGSRGYGADGSASGAGGNAGTQAPPVTPPAPARTVQETDLYRLDGNRLYYLNSYRGLMVFDVTNPDRPRMLGRSPIFGNPVDMIVRSGIAIVVIGDWFGRLDDGTPFHGSIVRGIDASDPANIRILGEAKLGGWVQDTRVVGDVLYAVGLAWPGSGEAVIHSLALTLGGKRVQSVSLVGSETKVQFSQGPDGLRVVLPKVAAPKYAYALRVRFDQ